MNIMVAALAEIIKHASKKPSIRYSGQCVLIAWPGESDCTRAGGDATACAWSADVCVVWGCIMVMLYAKRPAKHKCETGISDQVYPGKFRGGAATLQMTAELLHFGDFRVKRLA